MLKDDAVAQQVSSSSKVKVRETDICSGTKNQQAQTREQTSSAGMGENMLSESAAEI